MMRAAVGRGEYREGIQQEMRLLTFGHEQVVEALRESIAVNIHDETISINSFGGLLVLAEMQLLGPLDSCNRSTALPGISS